MCICGQVRGEADVGEEMPGTFEVPGISKEANRMKVSHDQSLIVVDQSRTSDAFTHAVFRVLGFVLITVYGLSLPFLLRSITAYAGSVSTAYWQSLFFAVLCIAHAALVSSSVAFYILANPYPKLWVYQEGILLRHWNKDILLNWKDVRAVRERSHEWRFWRRDKLTIYCEKLPFAFGHYEKKQGGVKKFYVMGDATNFGRLNHELRARSSFKEAH
jgi:hypothetical protein